MHVCIESNNPLEIYLAAARLRDAGFDPEVINEASYVTAYPGVMGLMAVVVPDAEFGSVCDLLSREPTTSLPEEPEFMDEIPPGSPLLPFVLSASFHEHFRLACAFGLFFLALGLFYIFAAWPVMIWWVK